MAEAPSPNRYLMYLSQNYGYAILRPLQAVIRARGDEVRWFLAGHAVHPGYLRKNEIRLFSIASVIQWRPDAVFVPGNVVPAFIPGIKVQVFHGLNSGKVNRRGRDYHFEIRGCFDLYCTHGPSTTEKFCHLARKFGTFTVRETGWPALDPLFASPSGRRPGAVPGRDRPVVLMCSTFSRKLSCAPIIMETIRALSREKPWHWRVQFHPKMDPAVVAQYKALACDTLAFVETDNVIPLLQSADVMLSDTSAIVQMFLMQHKPVVTFRNSAPGPHLLDIAHTREIGPALETALTRPAALMDAITRYCDTVHPSRDGRAGRRVLAATDDLVARGLAGLKPKPLNLIRQCKMRKTLGYWKW